MKKQKNMKVLPVVNAAGISERRIVDKINKTGSVAKESGSFPQTFNRIKDIIDIGTGIRLILNPVPGHPEVSKTLTYEEALAHLVATKKTIATMPLEDAKAAAEVLVALERRLLEALESEDIVPASAVEEMKKL